MVDVTKSGNSTVDEAKAGENHDGDIDTSSYPMDKVDVFIAALEKVLPLNEMLLICRGVKLRIVTFKRVRNDEVIKVPLEHFYSLSTISVRMGKPDDDVPGKGKVMVQMARSIKAAVVAIDGDEDQDDEETKLVFSLTGASPIKVSVVKAVHEVAN